MRPHEGDHRREEDRRLVARVGFSPWTNLAHLGGTAAIIIALVTLGGNAYSTQQQLVEATYLNTQRGESVEKRVSDVEISVSVLEARAKHNQDQIGRVEQQSSEDRERIITQLDRLNDKIDRLLEDRE